MVKNLPAERVNPDKKYKMIKKTVTEIILKQAAEKVEAKASADGWYNE